MITDATAGWPSWARLAAGLAGGVAAYGSTTLVTAVRKDLVGVVAWGRQMLGR